MRKNLKALLITLTIICAMPTGCVKDPDGNNPISMLPDLTNFAIEAVSTWTAGAATMVSLMSTSLGSGDFTVHYNLTGANVMSGLTALITMSGGHGSFQTPVLATAGETNVVITSVSNSNGSSTPTSNNTYTFSDSSGLMTGTLAGNSYRATHVDATWLGSGATLSIHAIKWTPLTPVNLYVDNWNNTPTTISFNSHNSTAFLGSASYSLPASPHLSEHGTISITTVSPLITGTFSFKCEDSSVVSGSLSCPHP